VARGDRASSVSSGHYLQYFLKADCGVERGVR